MIDGPSTATGDFFSKRAERAAEPALACALARLFESLDGPVDRAEFAALEDGIRDDDVERLAGPLLRRLGYRLRIEKVSARGLKSLALPAIVMGERAGSALFVQGRTGPHFILVDPVSGTTMARDLAGTARLAARIVRIVPATARAAGTAGQPSPLWQQTVMQRLRPALLEVGIASATINVLALATPIFMMTVYNKVIGQAALQTLDVLAIGMATLFAFELVLRAIRGKVASHTGARLDVVIGATLSEHLLNLPYRRLEEIAQAGAMERLRQLDQLRGFLTGQLPLLLVDMAFVGLFVGALFVIAPTLAWITTLSLPLFLLLSLVARRRQSALAQRTSTAGLAKARALDETFNQVLTIKAMGLEQAARKRLESRTLEAAWSGYRQGHLANTVGAMAQALQHGVALLLIYVGASQIIAGELSVGALIAATILSARAIAPMRQVMWAWHQFQQARDAFAKLEQLMGTAAGEPPAAGGTRPVLGGRLTVENVTFRYAAGKPPALDMVDLGIEPGTMLGIVGPPGSGKSTLAKMLAGLERPEIGHVRVDGQDMRRIDRDCLRQQIAMVPQDIQLFEGTIAENIALGAADRSYARVLAASRFAGLDETVRSLPDGYDTVLGPRGSGLSNGQRQLIAIARAIVRNPRVLILDEATSALDMRSEAALLHNLRHAARGRTIVFVTHRMSVLESCDQAILMRAGRITHAGSPHQVIAEMRRSDGAPTLAAVR